uniref:Uncharacterized protein n=1 Tax=Arundo donax TaxID=35708 RepID=A0A0A8ZB52_ARUDO
MTHKCTRLS